MANPKAKKPKAPTTEVMGVKVPPALQKFPKEVVIGVPVVIIILVVMIAKVLTTPVPQDYAPQVVAPVAAVQPTNPQAETPADVSVEYVGPQGDVAQAVATELPVYSIVADDLKELGRQVTMTQETFQDSTTLFQADATEMDPFLNYMVLLPKGWERNAQNNIRTEQLSDRLLVDLASYSSPVQDPVRSHFYVKAQKLPFMMTARDWIYQYALGNHYTLQAVSSYAADRAEAIYVTTQQDVSYVARIATIINGPRVVIAEYLVPLDDYEAKKDMQTWGITSFYLKTKDGRPGEDIKDLPFFDIATLTYPKSWFLQSPNIAAVDRMSASLMNTAPADPSKTSALFGRIDVVLFSDDDKFNEDNAVNYFNGLYNNTGLRIGDPIGRFAQMPNNNGLTPLRFEVRAANNIAGTYQDYQYWLAVYKFDGYYYYVGLLTPPRGSDTVNWSRNFGAFDYVIRTLKPGV